MISWFKSVSLASSNGGDVLCVTPSRLEGRSIIQSTEDDFYVNPSIRMLIISLSSTLSSVAVLLTLTFAVYRLRVRLHRRWKFHPFNRDECIGEDMDYDVFLCCSSEDHNPHGLHFLEQMESKGYRLLSSAWLLGWSTHNWEHDSSRQKQQAHRLLSVEQLHEKVIFCSDL